MLFLCYHRCRTLFLRNYFPYFIYLVLDIICSTMNNYQIRFFLNRGSDIINEVICCCSRMTSHFHWIITRNLLPIYIVDYQIASNKNFFTIELFADCRLIKLISAVLMYCCFIVLSVRGGLFIGLFISDSINSMIIRMVISYISDYTTLFVRLSILNDSTALMVK